MYRLNLFIFFLEIALTSHCELLAGDSDSSEPPTKKTRADAVSSSAVSTPDASSSVLKGRGKGKNLKERIEDRSSSSTEEDDPLQQKWFASDIATNKILTQAARAFMQKCELEKTYLQLKIMKLKMEMGLSHTE